MYASQTKRLCVRGATSDETRVQHHSPSSEATAASIVHHSSQQIHPQISSSSSSSTTPVANSTRGAGAVAANMTASATGTSSGDSQSPIKSPAASLITPHSQIRRTAQNQGNISDKNCNNSDMSAEHELINKLASETLEETKIELLLSIQNIITACNKKKDSLVTNPNFTKIVRLIDDERFSPNVKTRLALLLCSVAKSGEHNVKLLNDLLVDDKLFILITSSQDEALIEACLRCMRSIMSWPKVSRTWVLYDNSKATSPPLHRNQSQEDLVGSNSLQKIIAYAQKSNSIVVQECVADIFALTCNRNKDQVLLYRASAIPCIVQFIESPSCRVVISALNWLTQMCLKNHLVASEVVQARCPSGVLLLDSLTKFMNKDECVELQFLSARCFAHIYRALATDNLKDDARITSHVLPTLVRMVHRDKPPQLRAKAAECIAYLIECENRLQNIASICDRLIESLANMLEYEQNAIQLETDVKGYFQCTHRCLHIDRKMSWRNLNYPQREVLNDSKVEQDSASTSMNSDINMEINYELKRAAFLALATLASNLEPIRKKIFDTCSVMQHLVKSLTNSDTKTLKSVLTCLLSLSRSVQQLRTNFAENSVYSALKNLLSTSSNDILILVLAILCNISLDFSPGKQHFLDIKTIEILCSLTKGSDSYLRLHGMWILMNMVYQLKDQNLKFQIIKTLGMNHVLGLLEIEGDEEIVLKTLGFLRNVLSQRSHIDAIMSNYGDQIMQSLIRILERPTTDKIKEQTLCVLTNIADGAESKSLIMNNRVILGYLSQMICDEQAGNLRLAAICCITNLALKEQDGSFGRRDEMKKYGIEEKLKSMLSTKDPVLSDRVWTAYNQFIIGIDDKCVN